MPGFAAPAAFLNGSRWVLKIDANWTTSPVRREMAASFTTTNEFRYLTNSPPQPFTFTDAGLSGFSSRFYRVELSP